ncbi:DUF523 domain-containing protein [Nocardiopsis gilva YIM 90087]|uniref:DUF523 domain-containing protein n=1 Tax=Nocardiopsis gilva YIM 90087 TaxID=1235441 RepID=A0A223S5X5_9ACTN|nr:DUF523 domain-containing protein [Nocardiopsis gilva]ASU83527.1 DUF523 domain-containing protein [Nocardiopsis gilva YIM 90087]
MEKILVSACLIGRRVRFDGRAKTVEDEILDRWRAERRLVVHCPEVAGGLPVPRPPAEIEAASGATAVLTGNARIRTPQGADVTTFFLAGAHAALDTARQHGVRIAILKESSPSCGVHRVYDGSFTGATTSGPGVTARLLLDNGIAVFTESELPEAVAHLQALEASPEQNGL